MRSSLKLLAIYVSSLPATLVSASTETVKSIGSLKAIVDQAISKYEATPISQWSFEVSRYENEEGDVTSSIERYNPQRVDSSRWQLIKLNNRTPSVHQQSEFQQRKQDSDSSIVLRLSELIQIDSLEIVSEDHAYINASFRVFLERIGAEASEHLQGTLAFAKNGEFIEQIKITNTDSFTPIFTATIDSLELNLAFVKIDNAVLTQRIDLKMQGSFALFSEIDEVSSDVYSDYQFIGNCLNC